LAGVTSRLASDTLLAKRAIQCVAQLARVAGLAGGATHWLPLLVTRLLARKAFLARKTRLAIRDDHLGRDWLGPVLGRPEELFLVHRFHDSGFTGIAGLAVIHGQTL